MARFDHKIIVLVILCLSVLTAGCQPMLAAAHTSGESAAPIMGYETATADSAASADSVAPADAVPTGSVFVDLEPFQAALLQAIQSRDEAVLEQLMTENFVSGWWRGELGDLPRADALRELYQDQLGEEIKLNVVPGSDLTALMGGTNPLEILRPEANVAGAVLVTGWGKDGQDEAILFVSRQPDNALRWAGTLVIQGGFTSAETGGVEAFVNEGHGYQVYLPKGYEVQQTLANEVTILAPQGTEGHRERAFISVEPANGRTAEGMVEELKAGLPPQFAGQTGTVMGLDTEMAVILDRVPSQEMQRVLFVVHNGSLYRMIFIPHDENAGEAYNQMKNLYAVVVNTFRFLPAPAEGGKLVADLDIYLQLLGDALAKHDKPALQSMIGEPFKLAFFWGEGSQITQDEAFEQILNNYAPAGAQLTLDPHHPVLQQLFPEPNQTEAGEEVIPVFVSGWGLEGQDEAVLFIARRADGSLYWQGVLTAIEGF